MLKVIRHPHSFSGYTFIITNDGIIHQTRKLSEEGAHVATMNTQSIGICIVGNFSRLKPPKEPNEAQEKSFKDLAIELMKKYNIPLSRIVPHKFFSLTECYGKNLKGDYAKNLVMIELKKYDKRAIKIELLKTQISILERMIQLYTIFLRQLMRIRSGKAFGGPMAFWHEEE